MIKYIPENGVKAYPPTCTPADLEQLRLAAKDCGSLLNQPGYANKWHKWETFGRLVAEGGQYEKAEEILAITGKRITEVTPDNIPGIQPLDLEK